MTIENGRVCEVEPRKGGPGSGVAKFGLNGLDCVGTRHLLSDRYWVAVDDEGTPGMPILDVKYSVRVGPSFDCGEDFDCAVIREDTV